MTGDWWYGLVAGVLFSVGIRELGDYIRARRKTRD